MMARDLTILTISLTSSPLKVSFRIRAYSGAFHSLCEASIAEIARELWAVPSAVNLCAEFNERVVVWYSVNVRKRARTAPRLSGISSLSKTDARRLTSEGFYWSSSRNGSARRIFSYFASEVTFRVQAGVSLFFSMLSISSRRTREKAEKVSIPLLGLLACKRPRPPARLLMGLERWAFTNTHRLNPRAVSPISPMWKQDFLLYTPLPPTVYFILLL